MRKQEDTAAWMGCSVEEMNANHDRLHRWLAEVTGLHSFSMDIADGIPITEEQQRLANYEEDAVLYLQRYLCKVPQTIVMTWPQYLRQQCVYRGRLISLSKAETEIVSTLLLNRGKPCSLVRLLEAAYPEPDMEPDSAADCVRHFLLTARHKLPGLIKRLRVGEHGGWYIPESPGIGM